MAGKSLSFDSGVVEYDVNGTAKVRFNPTDAQFIDRFYETVQALDRRQGSMQEDVDGAGDDPQKMFEMLEARDAEMRASVDGLLGEGTADAVFPGMNCYAMADGLPVWMNFMLAIADEIAEGVEAERGKSDPRAQKLSSKYDDLLAKYRKATTRKQA